MDETNDWQLLDAFVQTGSHAAFDALVRRHAGWIYAIARKRVISADLAEDITQATFIVLARKAKNIPRRQSLAAWLFRVARYAVLDAHRRQSARQFHERAAAQPEAAIITDDSDRLNPTALPDALDTLSKRDREMVILRFFNNQTLEQIGRLQDVAASTVQRRLERALAQLKFAMRRDGATPTEASVATMLGGIGAAKTPIIATGKLTALASVAATPYSAGAAVSIAKATIRTMKIMQLKIAAAAIIASLSLGLFGMVVARAVVQPQPAAPAVAAPVSTTAAPAPPLSAPAVTAAPSNNPPDGVDFAKQFSFAWDGIDLNVAHYNPVTDKPNQPRPDQQYVNVTGIVTVLDTTNIVGFERNIGLTVTHIIDGSGRDVTDLAQKNNWPADNRWYAPLNYQSNFDQQKQQWTQTLQPSNFNTMLDLRARLPRRFAIIQGDLWVLTCDHIKIVDVPFVANGPVTNVPPDAQLHFTQATQSGQDYQYKLVNDISSRVFNGQVGPQNPLPREMIIAQYLVNAAGKPIDPNEVHPFGNFPQISGGDNGSGGSPTGETIAAMRLEVAVGLRERQLLVTMNDVDLSVLSNIGASLPPVVGR